jgi:hypothetical protein
MIPQDSPSRYDSSMRNLAVLVIHLIATLARLLGPGGVRSLVAESLLLKHQLLARNCCLLGRRRYWGDSVSELFGFGLEALDL